jgi:hypothetical protein
MDEKSIRVCGLNFRLGVSTLEVDALRADGSLIDTAWYESQVLSFAGLYAKFGRRSAALLPELPWTHNLLILGKVSTGRSASSIAVGRPGEVEFTRA